MAKEKKEKKAPQGIKYPSGWATLKAYARAGLKELGQILPAFPGSVHPVEEPGTAANPTQIEVFQQRHEESPQRAMQSEQGGVHGKQELEAPQAKEEPQRLAQTEAPQTGWRAKLTQKQKGRELSM